MNKELAQKILTDAKCHPLSIMRYLNNFDWINQSLRFPKDETWEYCLPLAGNVKIGRSYYDLGICLTDARPSANILATNKPGDYSSGDGWASSEPYKQLGLWAYRFGMLSEQDLINAFAKHNALWMSFYENPKADVWKLETQLRKGL